MTKHAFITGGSSGIGFATAKILIQQRFRVTLVARNAGRLQAAEANLKGSVPKASVFTLSADVGNHDNVHSAIDQAEKELGPVDWGIFSAGVAEPGYFLDLPVENFAETMRINYFGSLYPAKILAKGMCARRSGHLAFVSSGAGLTGLFGYTSYSPTKFAVRGLAESLRGELRPYDVGVSVVYPPDTDTPQLAHENKTKPQETKELTRGGGVLTAHQVAATMVRGIQNRQFAIAPGWEMKALLHGTSVLSPVLRWHFDRVVDRVAQTHK